MLTIFSVPPSLMTGGDYDYTRFARDPEPRSKPSNPEIFTEFVEPPEMPGAIKAKAEQGATCYYGFYFPDAAVHAFNEAQQIECPSSSNPKSWTRMRRRQIMYDVSDDLGIRCFTRLQPFENHDDIVYFAYTSRIKTVTSQCLPVFKIKELMQALGIEGGPEWILV